uniref:hypothetical protein n=1 Tax=Neorhizobium sp. EC2-8 TaxID=3129230 RepID=UPI003100F25A
MSENGALALEISLYHYSYFAAPGGVISRACRGGLNGHGKRHGFLGTRGSGDNRREARLSAEGRELHAYIVGSSGAGKTELLKILMHHDVHQGEAALVVIDAHTDVCEQVARWPGEELHKRVVYLAPELFPDALPTLNPFQLPKGATERTKEKVANQLGDMIGDICRGGAARISACGW